jgi:hypothetical protein
MKACSRWGPSRLDFPTSRIISKLPSLRNSVIAIKNRIRRLEKGSSGRAVA